MKSCVISLVIREVAFYLRVKLTQETIGVFLQSLVKSTLDVQQVPSLWHSASIKAEELGGCLKNRGFNSILKANAYWGASFFVLLSFQAVAAPELGSSPAATAGKPTSPSESTGSSAVKSSNAKPAAAQSSTRGQAAPVKKATAPRATPSPEIEGKSEATVEKPAAPAVVETAPAPATSMAPEVDINLELLLKSASASNAQIREAQGDVEIAKAQLDRARAAIYPRVEATIIGAPIYEQTGDALNVQSNWGKWGPLVKGGIQAVLPLYTFGQIGSYNKAAEHQVLARQGQTEMKRLEVLGTLKETYYGYQLANDLEKLVDDLSKFLGEAVDQAEEQAKKPKQKGGVKPHDLFRLKTTLDDLKQKKLFASSAKQTAEKAVLWMAAMKGEKVPVPRLSAEPFEKKTLEEYLTIAKANRPELKALSEGQAARHALADAKRAQSYPVIFLGAYFAQAWSPVRTPQKSFFANDPFNRTEGGGGLGVKFDLEFWRHSAESAEERAQAMKLKATEDYAVPGIDLQVKKAFYEMEQAVASLEIAERRKTTSKKWFVQSAMGWSIGITPPKELLESLEGDGLARKNYAETIYLHNLALSKLTQAIGQEVTALKYK